MDKTTKRPRTKRKYFSQETAQHHVEHIKKNNKKRNSHKSLKITAIYKCKHCKFFHLTTTEQYQR